MSGNACVVGIDFGTDSVRSIVADATTGSVLGTSVRSYPRWADRLYCAAVDNRFRQHPLDYLESMEASVREALRATAGRDAASAAGLSSPRLPPCHPAGEAQPAASGLATPACVGVP